jgi:hypothetical protein
MPTNQPYKALKLVLVHSFVLGTLFITMLIQIAFHNWLHVFISLLFFNFNISILFKIFKKEREALDKMLSV